MSGTAAARTMGRLAAAAAAHCADLDPAARLTAAHAWVGGGAPRFANDLARHRAALQSALESALGAVSALAARQGSPSPGVPQVRTSVTVMVATPGPYRGVDPRAMGGLIAALDTAAGRLPDLATLLRAELAALCLPAGDGLTVDRIAAWAAEQARDLRRRLDLIQRAEDGTGLVPAGLIGFGLFGAFAADPGDAGTLLRRAASGDAGALTALLALQARGADPGLAARVHAWWRALPQERRDELVAAAPGGVGSLDGLPAAVRDRANRLFLTAEKARLTAECRRLVALMGRTGEPGVLLTLDAAQRALDKVLLVERALAPGGAGGLPHAYLLAFDPTGLGRLVVSWGDPDTADTTVTYVPGLGSRLDGADGDVERARQLWQQCRATATGRRVASIAWLGYDAPQIGPAMITPGTSVATEAPATAGAGALASFADGLHAAHRPASDARNVVLGHSYGSLVAGKAALLRPGRLADEFVFVGSPGVGVEHATDLGVPAAHVWVGEAGNDPVAYLGRFAADPGDASFGARRFFVQRTLIADAHSSYWNPHSASLLNMAMIVNGRYDALIQPKPLERPELLMPELAPDALRGWDR
ncbi:hypothetical protein GCM10009530_02230 [Microbispora corallina]|uniref:alpha/beta hydrolase n=1 Tax=Microbispora corallina TaxID=83302 RepID=UPI0031E1898F